MGIISEGFRDIAGRARFAWLWVNALRARRALYLAETELGLLAWEQAEFYGEEVMAHVRKVQEYEMTQASLMNTSAELSGSRAALEEELAREKARHDEEQATIAAERAPVATRYEEVERTRRQKLDAVERFNQALEELARTEKQLHTRSNAFLKVENPTFAVRTEAREVSDALTRIPEERKMVLGDQARARQDAAQLEPGANELRNALREMDAKAAAARERHAAVARRLTGEMSRLEREVKKSNVRMSHLDREKREPYQVIGACLANDGIGPLNQPEVLERVRELREKERVISGKIGGIRAQFAAANAGGLIVFYLLCAGVICGLCVVWGHWVR